MANTIEKVNDGSGKTVDGYNKIETWNAETIEEMAKMYRRVLELIGEDPEREGLLRTPVRVAKAMNYLTVGYNMNPQDILSSAKFKEEYRQMVIVTLISIQCVNTTCFPSSEKHMLLISPTDISRDSVK
jgi:GTP cyclohydrolase I